MWARLARAEQRTEITHISPPPQYPWKKGASANCTWCFVRDLDWRSHWESGLLTWPFCHCCRFLSHQRETPAKLSSALCHFVAWFQEKDASSCLHLPSHSPSPYPPPNRRLPNSLPSLVFLPCFYLSSWICFLCFRWGAMSRCSTGARFESGRTLKTFTLERLHSGCVHAR